jgi:putative acetyltransferase
MPVTIRAARTEDTNAICRVHRASIFGLSGNHYNEEQLEDWVVSLDPDQLHAAIAEADGIAYVAEDNGRIVGFSVLCDCVVRAVYVDPSAARRGVGSSLLKAVEAAATDLGIRTLYVYASLNSRCFYENNGYTAIKVADYPLSKSRSMVCIEMKKDLQN